MPLVHGPNPEQITALVVYACDNDDHYALPSRAYRKSLYARISDYFDVMSYGKHALTFKEATNGDDFFRSEQTAGFYKENYDKQRHVRGFGMFNEEILEKVVAEYGENFFADVDIIILVGTDGGPGWYAQGVNATGFGMLGVDFSVGKKTFGRNQRQGGFTVEIGSDFGTPAPQDDVHLTPQEVQWTIAHEYGHWLGLGHRGRNLGIYSLMGPQLYGNERLPEFGPPPLDIFHLMELGWLPAQDSTRVVTVGAGGRVTIKQVRARQGIVLARVELGTHESIFISYHKQSANRFDGSYPGEGLLVWHRRGRRVDIRCGNLDLETGRDHLDRGLESAGLPDDFIRTGSTSFSIFPESAAQKNLRRSVDNVEIADVVRYADEASFNIRLEQ